MRSGSLLRLRDSAPHPSHGSHRYVEQMDIHTAAQTVLDGLLFSARLRLPASVTKDQV